MKSQIVPFSLLLIVAVILLAGCNEQKLNPLYPESLGSIQGSMMLNATDHGFASNTKVAVYKSLEDYGTGRVYTFVTTDIYGSYSIDGLPPGQYYLDAWKDSDGDSCRGCGDYYYVYAPEMKCKPGCCWVGLNCVTCIDGVLEIIE